MPRNNPHMPDLDGPTYKITVRGAVHGQGTLADFYYTSADGVTPVGSQGAMREAFWDVVGEAWMQCVSIDWTLNSVLSRRVDLYGQPTTFTLPLTLFALDLPIVGVRTAACAPQTAICVKKQTNTIGQRGRGRWFFSGIPEADVTAGILTGAISDWNAFMLLLNSGLVAAGTDLIPVHVLWEEFPPTPPAIEGIVVLEGREMVSLSYDTITRSQRRRQVGRGI